MTVILLGVVTFLCNLIDEFGGGNLFKRPIITGPIVGLILGDMTSGIVIGATVELVFLGLFAVGAAIPPDVLTGGILAVAFAISSGTGAEGALLFAFPIASLILVYKNFYYSMVSPIFLHAADKCAEKGDINGMRRMHLACAFIAMTSYAIIVMLCFSVGADKVGDLLAMLPAFITEGMEVAAGMLPALGFALLGRMLINKKVIPYFFIGFVVVAYLGIPIVGIAVVGAMIALIMVNLESGSSAASLQTESGEMDDDDF